MAWGSDEVCPNCQRALDDGLGEASRSVSPAPSYYSDSMHTTQDLPSKAAASSSQSRYQEVTNFSSKLDAVVKNIENSPAGSKNLVFTSWHLTLDVLQRLLPQRG
ncbi:hypothetical protein GGR56DRAFT_630687 [Xylariaceae sp. FL0804]|nr:hypothetical protein GGR56DRAFT_630687 [Xylariaceae sp. FL0804]